MSKSVELLAGSEDGEPRPDSSRSESRSGLNLNGSRQLSRSATELRVNKREDSPSLRGRSSQASGDNRNRDSPHHHHHHHHRYTSVAQRTQTFFATLKSRWVRGRSKERKKTKDAAGNAVNSHDSPQRNVGVESDYAADYSSEHSRSSSATQSPARHCLNHPESPLARGNREKSGNFREDSPGRCSDGSSKGSHSCPIYSREGVMRAENDEDSGIPGESGASRQDEAARRRELALRQHAFFQLRLHIRRGANLVAMDRCGASDPYVKIKCSGRLLHKSRTVHRELNPVWDESVTLPIEDPFQPLNIKVFDYDWGLQDDFMGAAQMDLVQLDLGHPQDIVLELKDPGRPRQHLGELYLTATLWPRNQQEKEQERDEKEMPEEDTKSKDISPTNLEDLRSDTAPVDNEEKGNSSRDFAGVSTENVISGDPATATQNEGGKSADDSAKEEETPKTEDKQNQPEVTKSAVCSNEKTGSKDRGPITGKEMLSVRYVKMRTKKKPETDEEKKDEEKIGEPEELSRMKEKLLEGVLGVKAERCEGGRWVKLTDAQIESGPEITKRLNDVAKFVENDEEIGRATTSSGASSRIAEESEKPARPSVGNAGSRFAKTRNLVRKDCITLAREIRSRRKEKSAAFKVSLERRVESVEKILEDQVEKMLQDTAEKRPWLQPIESWLIDRYKSAKSSRSGKFPVAKKSIRRASSSDSEETCLLRWEKDEEERSDENDGGEVFIESVKENDDEATKKNESFLHSSSPKGSAESSPETPKDRESRKGGSDGKEETTIVGRIEKPEKSHTSDLFDKLRDGFKERVEDVQRYFQRTSRLADVNRKLKSQIWSSVVTIVLVEAKNLLPMDIDGLSDPYVKFRLGTEKYKSKVINKTLSPVWLEQFDLHLYEDPYLGQELEVTVWDRDKSHQDDLMGRTTIDLASMERETTHRLWRDLEDGAGQIFLLLTISGTTASETISDLAAHEETPQERARLLQKYALQNTLQRPRDVGHLTVKVYRAQGLAAADLGGKSDPFCVLELVNARLQTQTEYKTLAPNWQKIFTFNVKDINSVLEVTVYDEDRDHKVEFLGRVAIPLLRIRNAEKRWYALKDKKLRGRAKGNSPQILLEMIVVWNVLRACARTLNPKETKYMEPEVKFKRQVFLRNVLRLKAIIVFFIDMGKYIQSCWEWESKTRSIVALVLFVLLCYYFEPWMIPTAALLILAKYCMVAMLTGGSLSSHHHSPLVSHLQDSGDAASDDGPVTPGDDDDDEDDKDKEEKKSLKERLQAIQEVTQTVQNSIGYIASLCERIKNLFNFTVPYLSYLAIVLTILAAVVLYLIPMRYLILGWGVNKFLRKLLRPHSVPNNEVLDLISRVPDDEDLLSYRELKPVPTADCERGGTSPPGPSAPATSRRDQRKKHKAA